MSELESTSGSKSSAIAPSQSLTAKWTRLLQVPAALLVVPAAVATGLLMVHVVVDVAGRTLLSHPLGGTLEVTSNWWMVMIVFLGLAHAARRREHVRATVLTEMLPGRWRRAADGCSEILFAILALAMAVYGREAARYSHELLKAAPSNPHIPIWPFAYLVPMGCGALMLQCVANAYQAFSRDPSNQDEEDATHV